MFVIIAIANRPLTFNDDDNYLAMLDDFKYVNVSELGKISSLFYYLNIFIFQFISNLQVALKINFILIWVIIAISFFAEKVINKTFYFTFLLMLFQVLFFIQLRNGFAIVFLNWAILRYYRNKKFALLFLISILFHYSVLPFILVFYSVNYFVKSNNIFFLRNQLFKLLLAIVSSFFFYNFYNNYIVVMPLFEKYFFDYISTPEVGNTSILQMFLLIFHLFLFLPHNIKNYKINISVFIIFFGLLLGVLFFSLPLFQRIIVPFYLFSISSLVFIISKFSLKNLNIFYYLIVLVYFLISINRFTYFENWPIF